MSVFPRYIPVPTQDAPESGRLILRDGSTAQLRIARPNDLPQIVAFFEGLSAESRRRRFASSALPPTELIAGFCDNSDPRSTLTLIATRNVAGESRIIATASYLPKDAERAEVAFAVDDAFQGQGLGTLLLERLALLAVRHGVRRFWAVTHADNRAMREVFQESGFLAEEQADGPDVEVDLSVVPTEASVHRSELRDRIATIASLRPFFQPKSVAVVGASRDPASIGYRLLEALRRSSLSGTGFSSQSKR